uniref:[citrate (pro-3S)-lyase] ligase n=1 Tax=Candidatus Cryptobacteroides bacterium TaxID=3085639 RepID=UPI004028BB00
MCDNRHYISEAPLSLNSVRRRVEAFLAANGLRLAPLDRYVVVTRDEDGNEILAGGGLDGNVIKCVAVSESARSEGLMNILVSRLIAIAREEGRESVKAFTKPENEGIFKSLGFALIASSPNAILMENGRGGLPEYRKYLESLARPGRNGAIVMNANPFTKGHRYLVEQAASQVDNLYVIVVKEDRSRFPYVERKAMIEAGCAGLDNVVVCEGSDYAISAATFPTYFLKKLDDATDTQIALDLDLFVNHIAKPLGVTVRFAGSEPEDALTRRYNELMAEILPGTSVAVVRQDHQPDPELVKGSALRQARRPIDFVEIPRLEQKGKPLSATSLRRALDKGGFKEAMEYIPKSTVPYLVADLAERALRLELDTTPKPGLVDRRDNGAHKDMDYALMSKSISALRPYLTRLAVESAKDIDPAKIKEIGIEAEKAMLKATGGVNTHKGALFCIGLSVAAASCLACSTGAVEAYSFKELVSRTASEIPSARGTHGAEAKRSFKAVGALENARAAYPELFADWLPYYRSLEGDPFRCHKTLLHIMTTLDDTNILHRRGAEGLAHAEAEAARLLEDFSESGLSSLNKDFIRENISPGGSADMLSLTIFIESIINNIH